MSLLVTGSMALDTIRTPHGTREAILGGAASYFSVGAQHFTDVRLVAVIGEDFPPEHVELLRGRGVDLEGLERREGAQTFRWTGRYEGRMDVAETLENLKDRFFLRSKLCLPFAAKCARAAGEVERAILTLAASPGDTASQRLSEAIDALAKASRALDERSAMQDMAIT